MQAEVIVVTGGAGFIGSHIVESLLSGGARVIVLDDYSTGKKSNLLNVETHSNLNIYEVDLTQNIKASLTRVEEEAGMIDRVIHFAAQTAVVNSIENPIQDIHSNSMMTVHLLEYFKNKNLKKFIFASSAAVYGDVAEFPIQEDFSCEPLSPYGINKLASENYMFYYSKVFGIPSVALRFFNVYGPRQDPANPYSGVISIFLERAMKGLDLNIFGDGKQTRDFVYVSDVVQAIDKALYLESKNFSAVNIGSSLETSINQLAQSIVNLFPEAGSKINHLSARDGEIIKSLSSTDKARALLSFEKKISLEKGLAETAQWFIGCESTLSKRTLSETR